MNPATQPFRSSTAGYLIRIANQKATSIAELDGGVAECSDARILPPHVSHARSAPLPDRGILERLRTVGAGVAQPADPRRVAGGVDIRDYVSLAELRADLRRLVVDYCGRPLAGGRETAFEPFYFCESVEVTVPLGSEAHTLEAFRDRLAELEPLVLYYHFISSRLRLQLRRMTSRSGSTHGLGL